MKKNFLWFDKQLWSSLYATPKKRWHTDGAEHHAILGTPRAKHGDGVKYSKGRVAQ